MILLLLSSVCAQRCSATDVGGPLPPGVTRWAVEDSPYVVVQNVELLRGSTLQIDPGVEIRFNKFAFIIRGELIARGSVDSPIRFTSNSRTPTPGSWLGIRFEPSTTMAQFNQHEHYVSGSILEHCVVEYGKGITLYRSSPLIKSCLIRFNAKKEGGGLNIWHASPVVQNCVIERNIADRNGGGVRSANGQPVIKNCKIRFNTSRAGNGGGISSDFSAPKIIDNSVTHNVAINGGGIATGAPSIGQGYLSTAAHSRPVIVGNTLAHNMAGSSGGGAHIVGSPDFRRNLVSKNCLLFGHESSIPVEIHTTKKSDRTTARRNLGAGVFIEETYGGSAVVKNNHFNENTGAAWGGGLHLTRGTAIVECNKFTGNKTAFGGGGMTVVFVSEHQSVGSLRHGRSYEIVDNLFVGNVGGAIEFAGNGRQSAKLQSNQMFRNLPFELINHSNQNVAVSANTMSSTRALDIQKQVFDYFDNQTFGKFAMSQSNGPGDTEGPTLALTTSPSLTPVNLAAQPSYLGKGGSKSISLTWKLKNSPSELSHRVYYSTSKQFMNAPIGCFEWSEQKSPIVHEGTPSIIVKNLLPNQTYHFAVTTVDSNDVESAYSEIVSVRTGK